MPRLHQTLFVIYADPRGVTRLKKIDVYYTQYCQHLLFCDFEKKNDTEPDNLCEGDHTDPKAKTKESPNVADQADPGHKTN